MVAGPDVVAGIITLWVSATITGGTVCDSPLPVAESPQQSECVKMLRPQLHWETDATAFFPVKKFDILIIIDSIGCRLESTCVLGSPIVALDSFQSLSQSLPYTVSVYQTLLRFLTDGGPRNRPHQGIDEERAILRIKRRNFPDKETFCLSSPLW